MTKILFSVLSIVSLSSALSIEQIKDIQKQNGSVEALKYYKQLAKDNNKEAIFQIAKIYIEGKGIKRSYTTAKEYLEKAKDLNHNKSTYYLGKLYLSKKSPYFDLTLAYNTFVEAANNDYAPAQNMVGQFLVNGIAVDKDYTLAVKLFEKAAKQNYVQAQCNLAFMYAAGKGVFPNFGRAHQFAKKGKEMGVKRCEYVWKEFNLAKYPEDKGFKFNFYTTPTEE